MKINGNPWTSNEDLMKIEALSLKICGNPRKQMEINENDLFHNASTPIYHGSSRRLKSKDSKSTTKYINQLHSTLLSYNVFQRIENLLKNSTPDHSEAELLDQEITRATRQAETACRVRRSSSWNPSIHSDAIHCSILCQIRHRKAKGFPTAEPIKQADAQGMPVDSTTLDEHITDLRTALKEAGINSKPTRKTFLHQQLTDHTPTPKKQPVQ